MIFLFKSQVRQGIFTIQELMRDRNGFFFKCPFMGMRCIKDHPSFLSKPVAEHDKDILKWAVQQPHLSCLKESPAHN